MTLTRDHSTVLVFADAVGPSQSLAFIDGLAQARQQGCLTVKVVAEAEVADNADAAVRNCFEQAQPSIVVASRLGNQDAWRAVRACAAECGAPIVFHVDDDLFDLPISIGAERYRLGRNPRRIHVLEQALQSADLVLVSTPALAARLTRRAGHTRFAVMTNGTAGRLNPRPQPAHRGEYLVVGYMGSASHNADLAMIAPALNTVMARHPNVSVTLFGSIAFQPSADLIVGRVHRHKAINGDYGAFKRKLAELAFDIGLAPLQDNAFNRAKTVTKWVEYAEAGIPTLASATPPYRTLVESGAAAGSEDHQWVEALYGLIESPDRRRAIIDTADLLLLEKFRWEQLEQSVLSALRSVAK